MVWDANKLPRRLSTDGSTKATGAGLASRRAAPGCSRAQPRRYWGSGRMVDSMFLYSGSTMKLENMVFNTIQYHCTPGSFWVCLKDRQFVMTNSGWMRLDATFRSHNSDASCAQWLEALEAYETCIRDASSEVGWDAIVQSTDLLDSTSRQHFRIQLPGKGH